jgi:hypothetical protein
MPKLQSLFHLKTQHCFSICLSTVSTFVTVVFQHMFQHCVSSYVTALFQHMFQHCFSICSSTVFQHMFHHGVSAYVTALCFSICYSTVFQHMFQHMLQHCFSICSSTVLTYAPTLCFSICSSTVFQHIFQHCVSAYVLALCFSICYNHVSAYVPALFQHMFQHCFRICSSTGFGFVPFFAICMIPFRLRLVKVDPPWLASRLHTCVLVPSLRLYFPPHPLLYSTPSGHGTLDMSQTFEGGGVSWPTNY